MRAGLVALLRQFDQGAEVVQASDAAEGLRLAEAHPDLDVVFLDLNMPDQEGMDLIPIFAKRFPQLRVIVLSSSEDPNDVRLALKSGAVGYVPKSASPKNILSALRLVLAGEIYVPPLMADIAPAASGGSGRATSEAGDRLTERQTEVLRQLCRGLSNKEISRTLELSDPSRRVRCLDIPSGKVEGPPRLWLAEGANERLLAVFNWSDAPAPSDPPQLVEGAVDAWTGAPFRPSVLRPHGSVLLRLATRPVRSLSV